MTVQFKTTGVPLFKATSVVAMDPDCCCDPLCFICTIGTAAIYDTVTFTTSGSSCALTNDSSSHFNSNWCRDSSAGGPLTVGSMFFGKCPLGSGAYFFIFDPWTNEVDFWETDGLSNTLIDTFSVCPPNTFVVATSKGFTLTMTFT